MEQTSTIRTLADKMELAQLDAESPANLDLPIWMLDDLLERKDHPRTPESILGVSPNENENLSLREEFRDLKGYKFSWGYITESFTPAGQYDDDDLETVSWNLCPEELLRSFCDPGFLEDVMVSMYGAHPLASADVTCDEAYGLYTTMGFAAIGTENIKATRKYLANTFVPKVLPDILAAVYHLLKTTEGKPVQRNKEWLNWMCQAQSGSHLLRSISYQKRRAQNEDKLVGADIPDAANVPKAWMS